MPAYAPTIAGATFNAADVVAEREYFTLRRRNGSGDYARGAPRAASSTVTLAPMVMGGLKEVWGFEELVDFDVDATGAALGAVGYQIATDGGTVFYYWTGAAWGVAGGSNFSSAADLDAHIYTIALSGARSIVLRVRLLSDATLNFAPRWRGAVLHVEIEDRPEEDVGRSVHAFLTGNVGRFTAQQKLEVAGVAFVIESNETASTIERVFNLTDDPKRLTNRFAGGATFDASTQTVTLAVSQAIDSIMETVLLAPPAVRIGISDDELFKGAIPAVGVLVSAFERRDDLSCWSLTETSVGRGIARSRPAPDYHEVTFNLFVMAKTELDAVHMARAVEAALVGQAIPYLPTGEPLPVLSCSAYRSEDLVAKNLYVKRIDLVVLLCSHGRAYTQMGLIQGVMFFGPGNETYTT